MECTFFVPGAPVPMPRQRFRIVLPAVRLLAARQYTPANGLRRWLSEHTFIQPYPDKTAEHHKRLIERAFVDAAPDGVPWLGPVGVSIVFMHERPKSITRKRGNPRLWKQTRSDIDNETKTVLDALNRTAWKDDGQIAYLQSHKLIAGDMDVVGTTVTIWPMEVAVSQPIEVLDEFEPNPEV